LLVASGSNAVMWQCNNSPNQRWDYDESSQQFKLHQNQSVDQPPLCLNIENSANANGALVQLGSCVGQSADTVWKVITPNTYGNIVSGLSGRCLDVTNWSQENGGSVQTWSCTGSQSNQQWYYNSTDLTIRSQLSMNNPVDGTQAPQLCLTAFWSPLQVVSFVSPDNTELVVVAMNQLETPVQFKVTVDIFSSLSLPTSIPPRSIQTYTIPL